MPAKTDDGHGRRYGDPYHGEQASFGDVEAAQLAHRFDQRSVHAGREEHGAPRNTRDQVGQAHEHTAGNVVEHIHSGCIGCLALGSSDIEEEVDDVAIGHHVGFSFASELAGFPDALLVVMVFEVVQTESIRHG